MRSLPFYTSDCKSEQDRADYQKYRAIEEEIEAAAKNLKKVIKFSFNGTKNFLEKLNMAFLITDTF